VLSRTLTFSPEFNECFFQELSAAAAVFLLRGEGEPYVSKTANLRRRLLRLLGAASAQTRRLNLRDRVREIQFTPTGSDFESQFLLYQILRETFPKTYAARLRLKAAPLVKLHLENEYPRASVTTRLGKLLRGEVGKTDVSPVKVSNSAARDASPSTITNLYYGPFPSRVSAEKFASDTLDFFKMRRCVENLHPDPSFPGCVYSEMKMCLAPCFKGCTDNEYRTEVARVQAFFDSRGESLTRELSENRDRTSAELNFEEAAAIQARIEKLKPVLAHLPEIVQRMDQLDAIVIQPSAEPDSVCFFRFQHAQICGPLAFKIGIHSENAEEASKPRTMEARVEEAIQSISPRQPISTGAMVEHLAILKRWYYRSQRVGEIFFAGEKEVWPLRRIVRGIGRVYKGEKQQAPANFSCVSG